MLRYRECDRDVVPQRVGLSWRPVISLTGPDRPDSPLVQGAPQPRLSICISVPAMECGRSAESKRDGETRSAWTRGLSAVIASHAAVASV